MYIGAKLTRGGLVMANFKCQLDWAREAPNICLHSISGYVMNFEMYVRRRMGQDMRKSERRC